MPPQGCEESYQKWPHWLVLPGLGFLLCQFARKGFLQKGLAEVVEVLDFSPIGFGKVFRLHLSCLQIKNHSFLLRYVWRK